MEYWEDKHFTANWENIPSKKRAKGDWDEIKTFDYDKVEYLIIWHHRTKEKTFENLPDAPNLKYLEVNWSGSRSLKGLEKFRKLKRLELHYCTKIESIADVCDLKGHLEYLHVHNSKKINDHVVVACCSHLKTLCFNCCGKIANLLFLYEMRELREFRFVDTKILSGDLTPIINHPKIQSVGFMNMHHYSHKEKEIDELLLRKKNT